MLPSPDLSRVYRKVDRTGGEWVYVSLRAFTNDGVRYYFSDRFAVPEIGVRWGEPKKDGLTFDLILQVCAKLGQEYNNFRLRWNAPSDFKDNERPALTRYFVQTGPDEHTHLEIWNVPYIWGHITCNNDGWCDSLKRYV